MPRVAGETARDKSAGRNRRCSLQALLVNDQQSLRFAEHAHHYQEEAIFGEQDNSAIWPILDSASRSVQKPVRVTT